MFLIWRVVHFIQVFLVFVLCCRDSFLFLFDCDLRKSKVFQVWVIPGLFLLELCSHCCWDLQRYSQNCVNILKKNVVFVNPLILLLSLVLILLSQVPLGKLLVLVLSFFGHSLRQRSYLRSQERLSFVVSWVWSLFTILEGGELRFLVLRTCCRFVSWSVTVRGMAIGAAFHTSDVHLTVRLIGTCSLEWSSPFVSVFWLLGRRNVLSFYSSLLSFNLYEDQG